MKRLLAWLRRLAAPPPRSEPIPEPVADTVAHRSLRAGDLLTDDEFAFLTRNSTCPDCQRGDLLEGPSGGLSTNLRCGSCSAEFNHHGFGANRLTARAIHLPPAPLSDPPDFEEPYR